MTTVGERKCALLLASMEARDRRWLLGRLPGESSRRLRVLVAELESMRLDLGPVADALLGDELRGLTEGHSIGADALVEMSARVSPAWFARVLDSWTGIDNRFCISLLEAPHGRRVAAEISAMPALPAQLRDAIRKETESLVGRCEQAPGASH